MDALPRDLLAKALNGNPRVVAAFEDIIQTASDTAELASSTASATDQLQDASFITLAPNATLTGERVLLLGDGLKAADSGSELTISTSDRTPHVQGGFPVYMTAQGATNLVLPLSGKLATIDDVRSPALPGPYASDAAAGTAGVVSGRLYTASDGSGGFIVKVKA